LFNTLIPLSRELWPIDGVRLDRCSRMTAAVEFATARYTTPDTAVKIATCTTSVTVK